jgi:hypothetical protein
MKKLIVAAALILISGSVARGQDTYYSIFKFDNDIPRVRINDRAYSLQRNLFPQLYLTRSVSGDLRWVTQNDSSLAAFWTQQGDTVLHILNELSGISWHEQEFDIYLVRFFPTVGSSDPLIMPLGGIYKGQTIEAAPQGNRLILDLVFQLAKRMLVQVDQSEDSMVLPLARHPLMRPSAYRLDNLAMLLAINTCQNVIGIDSTQDAYESAFWKNRTPGREIFEKYFLNNWVLTPDQTLADWITAEPYNSELVRATAPPRPPAPPTTQGKYIEGLPLKGELGFSTKINDDNMLGVDQIDVYRLAYASGLREGDIIRRVNGVLVRNQKALIEEILKNLDNGGATLEISRDGQIQSLVIQQMDLPFFDSADYQDEPPPDSTLIDTLGN